MAEFTVKLPLSELFPSRLAFSLCIYPVCVEWANIEIAGSVPRFGKQLFPCLWAYLFISGCSLQESVISSPWKGSACTLHVEATPLIHCWCYWKRSHIWLQKSWLCKCVVVCVGGVYDNILVQFSFIIRVFFSTQWFMDRFLSFLSALGAVTEATCPSGFRG